ncbi:MAG: hypothetical protein GX647_06750 [Clostridiales bacterium]|jgi:hypothetical protein|nr:hypothetical protein [Clostridiales bacterium]OPZ70121.1 MAG: hypothetical protein BWY81_00082 [Firmicutes bacterium ADurb.Bin467]
MKGIYPDSVRETANGSVMMANLGDRDALIATDKTLGFAGKAVGDRLECELTHENAVALRAAFAFTAPVRVLTRERTLGVGDRLGIATPGHIRAFRAFPGVSPVFAQQSIRELTLTNRTFDDVLDAASFSVFREGFTEGFGADGDHLKTPKEVDYALNCGYTMITLDCSEHIRSGVTDENCAALYEPEPELEKLYLDRTFEVGEGVRVSFDERAFRKTALVYADAVRFAARIYHEKIASPSGDRADFEMSIDETATPTTPAEHFFVASELDRLGVHAASVAPRFCGEFQKGIDYIGDLSQFEEELKAHAAIARRFGYKLSIHSGSDKFSVFPLIGKETRGRFHVKTAGTNWLQAVLLIAERDPKLYREVHAFALKSFPEARKYYHVTTDLAKVPDLSDLSDAQLPKLFEQNDARQLIHITYGLILNEPRLRERLYAAWRRDADALDALVATHIERHMKALLEG